MAKAKLLTVCIIAAIAVTVSGDVPALANGRLQTPAGTAWMVYQPDGRLVAQIPSGVRSTPVSSTIASKV